MPIFPYYGFNPPFFNINKPNNYYIPKKTYKNTYTPQNDKEIPKEEKNKSSKKFPLFDLFSNNNEDFLFDLFGIKLYFDDILILSLLFFLYTEGVKDYWLFISLLLLLIS